MTGCKSLTADGGMAFVELVADAELRKDVVAIRTAGQAEEAQARVAALLRKPLTADSAVQIALLNNRGLQAAYNALGIAEAAMVQAQPAAQSRRFRSSDCRVRWSSRSSAHRRQHPGACHACRRAPRSRRTVSGRRKLQAAEETLRVAAEARRAYLPRRRGARRLAAFLAQAKSAAETATKLARASAKPAR